MRSTIQHALARDNPAGCFAFIDTMDVFFRTRPKGLWRVRAAQGNRWIKPKKCYDRRGELCGYRLPLHQPTRQAILILDELQATWPQSRITICRLDISLDITGVDLQAWKRWLTDHALLRWRRPGLMHEVKGTIYWVFQIPRQVDQSTGDRKVGNTRSSRDLVLYDSKPSKITGQPCVHLELRFLSAASVRRLRPEGFVRPSDALSLKPREIFERHIRLVEFDTNTVLRKLTRKSLRESRALYRGKACHSVIDRYVARIPHRVKALVQPTTQMRAQRLYDMYGIDFKSINIAVLGVPEQLTVLDNNRPSHPHLRELSNVYNDGVTQTENHELTTNQSLNRQGGQRHA